MKKFEIIVEETATIIHTIVVEAETKEEVENAIDYIGEITDVVNAQYEISNHFPIIEVNKEYNTNIEASEFGPVEEVEEEN